MSTPQPGTAGTRCFLVAVGLMGGAVQLVLLRELMTACGGNELSTGVTVALWILCEALGAWLAGRAWWPQALDSLLTALSILSSLASVPAAVLIRPVFGMLPGEALSVPLLVLATFVVVLLPAAAHGALFVVATAGHARAVSPDAPGNIGAAYAWEGAGTVLSGLACFLLFSRMPSLTLVALFSLPLALVLLFAPFGTSKLHTRLLSVALTLATLTALALGLPIEKLAWKTAWRGQHVVSVANSPYGKIVRLERAGQTLVLYDGVPILSVPTTRTERNEELALLPVLAHPRPQRLLVLGHDLETPAELVRFRPDLTVTAVQLDPVLARTSLAVLSFASSLITHHSSFITSDFDSSLRRPPFSLATSDPASFLRSSRDSFDCIILTDAAPSSLGSSRLFTHEFYRLCHSRLASGGMLAVPGPGNPAAVSPDVAAILATRLATLCSVFRHVQPVAADFPLFLASDSTVTLAPESLVLRLAQLAVKPEVLDSSYLARLLDPLRRQALASALATSPARPAAASSVVLPRELLLNMVRDNRLISPWFGRLYARAGDLSPRLLLVLGAAFLIAGMAGARGPRCGRNLAILTSGLAGAAVSSLLLFSYQVRFGSAYSGIALLVTSFMLGTVIGGLLGSHLCRRDGVATSAFVLADLALAGCAAVVVPLLRSGPAAAFLSANLVAGLCLGLQFAIAGSATSPDRHSPIAMHRFAGRRTGTLTALDLAGGCFGGLLTALVLVPVWGIGIAALSAVAVKLTSVLVSLAAPARVRPV